MTLLVGRIEELASFERLLDELDRGHPGALELAGEPGIGKTRLLGEVASRAESRGHVVLSGSASELERELPFSVFVDALNDYVGSREPRELAALDDTARSELAQVLPSLSALGGNGVALPQERHRTHLGVRRLLEGLAAAAPLVLVLDDIHWADSASLELLGALLRRPPTAPVLIALAVRPAQAPQRLLAALERVERDASLTRLELGALSRAEAGTFLGDRLDPAGAATLYEECGGNPFYLQQLSRAMELAPESAAAAELSSAIDVPSAVAAALTEELALLSECTRSLIEAAAVAGDPFEPELAAAAAQTSEDAAMDAIDELVRLDLIRTTDVPRRFRFRHPIVRRAVYEITPAGWRLRAHERCAAALANRGAAAAARAHHVERSAREGDLEAVTILREAGEASAPRAPESAVRWFSGALRLLPQTTPPQQRLELLLARAGSLAATGRFIESHADLIGCIEIATKDAAEWRVRVTTACASIEHLLGLQKQAHRHLAAAFADLGEEWSGDAVELMIQLTVDAWHAGDLDAMRGWAGRAVAAATALDDRPLLAAARAILAWAGALAGDGERAQNDCDEATVLIDGLSDEDLAGRLDGIAYLAGADLYLDRFPATTRHGQRALEVGRATGHGEMFPFVIAVLGGSLWIQGRPHEAGELFDGAVEAARLAGNVQSLAWSLFNRSSAALVSGDVDVALATAEESCALEADLEAGPFSALAAAVLAAVMFETGHPDRSVDLLLTGAGGEGLPMIGGGWRARFLELLTRALLATGRPGDAQRAVAAAQACADATALPSAAATARLAKAALQLDAGRPASAAELALEAAAAFASVDASFDEARARADAGRALAQRGDRERAALELELAEKAFESFGSLRYRDQVERDLRKLGKHVYRRSRPGVRETRGIGALTERELEIARLVVDRRTNPEIAAALFLSLKTVETHLRNIFRKLDVSSRVQLARTVEAADRAGGGPVRSTREP